jgi:7-cyano-7-deazaguanine synthase
MKSCLLLSGGMDSVALAYWKRPHLALTINYGQKPALGEIRAATKICEELKIAHEIISVDCSSLGVGDLAGKPSPQFSPSSEWWPFRNQMLITFGAMRAISTNIQCIIFGTVKSDGFHADGKKEFFEKLNLLLKMQEGAMEVLSPGIDMSTAELIKISGITPDLLAWSHSCHTSEFACGNCRGCFKHESVMLELGYELC